MKIMLRLSFGSMLTCLFLLFSTLSYSQIVIDGCISCDTDWLTIGTKLNANSGFGANQDVSEILYFPDVANGVLYLAVAGMVDPNNFDGIGIWLDFTEKTGVPAGTNLGFNGGPHYIGGGGSNFNFQADFEVDYMFALNTGNTGAAGNMFVDLVDLVGGTTTEFLGSTSIGTPASTPNTGGIFTAASVNFAFNNGGGGGNGFEIAIPYSELGVTTAGDFRISAFIVSATGFFSDVSVPGDITTGNPGFNLSYNSIPGGPYHAGQTALPIDFEYFNATLDNKVVHLQWGANTELVGGHFEIQRSRDLVQWRNLGSVTQKVESTGYQFQDMNPNLGDNYYQIVWIDPLGSRSASKLQTVKWTVGSDLIVFPNPVVDELQIQMDTQGQDVLIRIFDARGQMQLTAPLQSNRIAVDHLANGWYWIEMIQGANQIGRSKFLKQGL